jgi:hypothetical protein
MMEILSAGIRHRWQITILEYVGINISIDINNQLAIKTGVKRLTFQFLCLGGPEFEI